MTRDEQIAELRRHLAEDNIREAEACSLVDHELVRWFVDALSTASISGGLQ